MKISNKIRSHYREFKFLTRGLVSTDHPVLVHLIPIRRCNLSCSYCNEYDSVSAPVPIEVLLDRVDRLARLGTGAITISGGEPLLHPDLERVIKRAREHGILIGLITNGYLLTRDRIQKLNEAGLEYLQISIDNVNPDEVSKKSLKVLNNKLVWLSEFAEFRVNINSVVGGGIKNPEDALEVGRKALELGFSSTIGVIHDGFGTLRPLEGKAREVFFEMQGLKKKGFSRVNGFQQNLADGRPNNWRCRAGARYLYVCEDGLVHYCSQQRGYPGVPLEEYTREDMRREYLTRKACADYCTVSCVNQVSTFDNWRDPQTLGMKGAVRREAVQAITTFHQIERSRRGAGLQVDGG